MDTLAVGIPRARGPHHHHHHHALPFILCDRSSSPCPHQASLLPVLKCFLCVLVVVQESLLDSWWLFLHATCACCCCRVLLDIGIRTVYRLGSSRFLSVAWYESRTMCCVFFRCYTLNFREGASLNGISACDNCSFSLSLFNFTKNVKSFDLTIWILSKVISSCLQSTSSFCLNWFSQLLTYWVQIRSSQVEGFNQCAMHWRDSAIIRSSYLVGVIACAKSLFIGSICCLLLCVRPRFNWSDWKPSLSCLLLKQVYLYL